MKLLSVIVFSVCAFLLAPPLSHAIEEHTGTLESRPEGKAGTWVVGGRRLEATDKTELEAEYGPIKVGGCAVVEVRGETRAVHQERRSAKVQVGKHV